MEIYLLLSDQAGAIAAYEDKEEAFAECVYYNKVLEIRTRVKEIKLHKRLKTK